MNENPFHNHRNSDDKKAHNAAFYRMAEEYCIAGQLNCADYLIEYHNKLGKRLPEVSSELLHTLDSMPSIRSDLPEMDLLSQAFERSNLEIPIGVHDLPRTWGRGIRELMMGTCWTELPQCQVEDVFGWKSVFRFGPYLHICFLKPFARDQSHWCEIGSLIYELHRRLEPGPYTQEGRLVEFLV
ncbi:MAG: hypothetical protein ACSHX4_10865 [Opitutaceae bacterium]